MRLSLLFCGIIFPPLRNAGNSTLQYFYLDLFHWILCKKKQRSPKLVMTPLLCASHCVFSDYFSLLATVYRKIPFYVSTFFIFGTLHENFRFHVNFHRFNIQKDICLLCRKNSRKVSSCLGSYLNCHPQPFTAPSEIPFTKYFCI
jgi:hypothetical protein